MRHESDVAGIQHQRPDQRERIRPDRRVRRRQTLVQRVERLNEQSFYFSEGITLTSESDLALAAFVAQVSMLSTELADVGFELQARVIGYADEIGGPEVNTVVASDRASRIDTALGSLGWQGAVETDVILAPLAPNASVDLTRRRATVAAARSLISWVPSFGPGT